jgi:hypothetical protein
MKIVIARSASDVAISWYFPVSSPPTYSRPALDESGSDRSCHCAAIWRRTLHQIATSLALLAMTRLTEPPFFFVGAWRRSNLVEMGRTALIASQ